MLAKLVENGCTHFVSRKKLDLVEWRNFCVREIIETTEETCPKGRRSNSLMMSTKQTLVSDELHVGLHAKLHMWIAASQAHTNIVTIRVYDRWAKRIFLSHK